LEGAGCDENGLVSFLAVLRLRIGDTLKGSSSLREDRPTRLGCRVVAELLNLEVDCGRTAVVAHNNVEGRALTQ